MLIPVCYLIVHSEVLLLSSKTIKCQMLNCSMKKTFSFFLLNSHYFNNANLLIKIELFTNADIESDFNVLFNSSSGESFTQFSLL